MKRYFRGRLRSLRHGDSGFTLVELLVVVGIIVALAAVIIPNVASFANKGDTGAQAAERDNIQAAIDTYMADNSYAALPGTAQKDANNLVGGSSSRDFTTTGILDLETAGPSGGAFLREPTSTYWYCWDLTGLVTVQDTATTTDCTRTN